MKKRVNEFPMIEDQEFILIKNINKIDDDKMVITFNYREQTKTITFADLEKSGIGSDINAVAAQIITDYRQAVCDFLLYL